MGAVMKGRRLPDGPMADHFDPGDYQVSEGGTNLYMCLPRGKNAFCMIPINQDKNPNSWICSENEDESLTVTPSIYDTSQGGYHGFLINGIWSD